MMGVPENPGCVVPSTITGSVIVGSAEPGWIVLGPAPITKRIVSVPAVAFAAKMASRSEQCVPLHTPSSRSFVELTVKVAAWAATETREQRTAASTRRWRMAGDFSPLATRDTGLLAEGTRSASRSPSPFPCGLDENLLHGQREFLLDHDLPVAAQAPSERHLDRQDPGHGAGLRTLVPNETPRLALSLGHLPHGPPSSPAKHSPAGWSRDDV